jgi:cell division protein FtsI/penicillin-binding protein 2
MLLTRTTMRAYSLLLIPLFASLQACSSLEKHSFSSQAEATTPVGTDGVFQGIVDREVDMTMKEIHPKRMVVVAIDPKTGQILAETSRRRGSSKQTEDAKTWVFGPGSAFKTFVVAAALEDCYVDESTTFDCGSGAGMFSGLMIKDYVPSGKLKVGEILQKSSNVGMARIGSRIPSYTMDYYTLSFGFGSKTGISSHGEQVGIVNASSSCKGITKVRMSIGQSVGVTPIQLVMAYSALANGGVLLKPKEAWDAPAVQVRRVVSEKTALMVRRMLGGVVSEKGTAPLAKMKRVPAGGKTGTAQVIMPGGNYSQNQYVTLFAGFYPVENPRVVCLVVVDQASVVPDCNYGGLICAPIFSRICNQAVKSGF